MDISVAYFKDEVRCGFYIPTAMKQAWAASLSVLAQIDRICKKYDISYYAEWGSLLGAVRHGGFIPWDDDLDIGMTRDNYEKFRQVADQELPEEFVIHDYERQEDHWLFLSRVVSNHRICFDKYYLDKYHNFPYLASVDIFVQDYLYDDEEKERARCEEITYLLACAESILEKNEVGSHIQAKLDEIEQKYGLPIRREGARNACIDLYRIAEKQMARVPREESSRVGQIFPWVIKGNKGLPKEYFEKTVRIPFEAGTIPVPQAYVQTVSARYGAYYKIYKNLAGHNYPFFESQRAELQKVANFKLPEFTFEKAMLSRPSRDADAPVAMKKQLAIFDEMLQECLDVLLHEKQADTELSSIETIQETLGDVQQLLVAVGTLLETTKGENNPSIKRIVTKLEEGCEIVYELFQIAQNEKCIDAVFLGRLTECKHVVWEYIEADILSKDEVWFVASGKERWAGFESLYQKELARDNCEVRIIQIPVYEKDIYGKQFLRLRDQKENELLADYPTLEEIALHSPKRIYIQDPYDGENPCLSVPKDYYAKTLLPFTEELIYVPPSQSDMFPKESYCDFYNMKHYVSAPGVIYADKIILQSEEMKQLYVEKLSQFAGEDTRDIWDKKITIEKELYQKREAIDMENKKKRIFYLIGVNELIENGDEALALVKERLETFQAAKEKLDTVIALYPQNLEEWMYVDKEKTEMLLEMLSEAEQQEWCQLISTDANTQECKEILKNCDAYYGSGSPYMTEISRYDKPIMISRLV